MQQKMNRSTVKRPFQCYIIHTWRLHSLRDISNKPEVIDINYPWYGDTDVYKKKICHSAYPPYTGQIQLALDNKYTKTCCDYI